MNMATQSELDAGCALAQFWYMCASSSMPLV
jgi:hypothetical protein